MLDRINAVILAAGKGTRLKIDTAKPLCPALGKCLVDYVVEGLTRFGQDLDLNFVVGHQRELVESHLLRQFSQMKFNFAHQQEQLGTGHAVQVFFEKFPLAWENKYTLIVCADTPLITSEVYQRLYEELIDNNYDAVCASFIAQRPFGYGRINHGEVGFDIVEEKDASQEQRKITEVNSGLYLFKTSHIKKYLNDLDDNNQSGEFYLTDLLKKDLNVKAIKFEQEIDFLGVNNLVQLEMAEKVLAQRKKEKLMLAGVRMINADSIYIEDQVEIEPGSVLHPNVQLFGHTKIAAEVEIEAGCILKNSVIGAGSQIKAYSYLEGTQVRKNASIGPMARLREGTIISDNCRVGNFVETKKTLLHDGVKVSHLSYVGDAEIGENTNIGCGFITCNYDGANKHKTTIGKDSFVGSDCQMIAPVEIGDEAYIGSGSTINKNVPSGAFAIARQRQVTKENMAHKFIKKKDKI
ncbi:MAG: bifunctional UDP-N-acetylglucosamine diphosphorylase/glucosamine-1-phosphate N-acetyltransferase GlmU [Bacteriovoracaceae bacterium]|jgi:bifunctional UDP-N-acetylglucosamine pyrophosphorylase/glucosamine-1-phosphate N-acetyltransferase|nr:UDP-N-acetylglucosamine diphosphorylase/glucosamine-1-phosphate N-acetyltransferase [Halobacteriovoraceae bacterium]MDP7321377.1 bifunctional UDP-N-acetylglucosamine diphosphorylase/glucosamine-1-phosphate N-acetyltransferase GlmU [Bacteriovoracaceae bacterium]